MMFVRLAANCNINAIFRLEITLFRGVFFILSAFSIESSEGIWRLYYRVEPVTFAAGVPTPGYMCHKIDPK